MAKKSNPFLEKMEEKKGKDLDGDGERGEPEAHQKKVLGKSKPFSSQNKTVRKKKTPPLMKNKKMTLPNAKKSRPSPGTGMKVCPKCKGKGLVSCSHM